VHAHGDQRLRVQLVAGRPALRGFLAHGHWDQADGQLELRTGRLQGVLHCREHGKVGFELKKI